MVTQLIEAFWTGLLSLRLTTDPYFLFCGTCVITGLVDVLSIKILAYIIFLVVPVLDWMSTHTFACFIKFMPLEAGVPDPPGFLPGMLEKRQSKCQFWSQLLGVRSKITTYPSRSRRISGNTNVMNSVGWLPWQNTSCMRSYVMVRVSPFEIHFKHRERAHLPALQPSPSTIHLPLVLCLLFALPHLPHTGHIKSACMPPTSNLWSMSMVHQNNCKPLVYVNGPPEQLLLLKKIKRHDIVILLQGTYHQKCEIPIVTSPPIQNDALELWSLFDFFNAWVLGHREIVSKQAKVLPFLLQRLKEDVLENLAPKIIQDNYCELLSIQKRLYEDFSNSQSKNDAEGLIKNSTPNKSSTQN
ncbi:uncharacterized protein VP01_4478g1, partial [Puccinia sorghi]